MAQMVPATRHDRKSRSTVPARLAHQRDQHEDQFARIHVAEQPHAVRYGLGDKLDHLHREVDRVQQPDGCRTAR